MFQFWFMANCYVSVITDGSGNTFINGTFYYQLSPEMQQNNFFRSYLNSTLTFQDEI